MVHPPAWSHRAWDAEDAEDAEDADVGAGWGGAGTQGAEGRSFLMEELRRHSPNPPPHLSPSR